MRRYSPHIERRIVLIIAACATTAPLARPGDRWALAEALAVLGDLPQTPGFAQLALRLGYGGDLPAQPRRPLAEVLLTQLP